MKVAMLIWSFWPGHEGGAERQCRKILEHANDASVDFVVLTSRCCLRLASQENIAGGRVIRLGLLTPFENMVRRGLEGLLNVVPMESILGVPWKRWSLALQFWLMLPVVWCSRLCFVLSLRSWLSRNRNSVDVIHVHEASWLAGVGAWLGKCNRIPVLAKTAISPALPKLGFDTPFRNFLDQWRRTCIFIAQREELAIDLVRAGIDRTHIHILPNGVDIPRKAARPELAGPVIYVGNFSQGAHWKAFDVLIHAWSMVCRQAPQARLDMLGAGDHSQWLRLAQELGCADSIRFLGRIADPALHYERACLFVLPSRVEGISNALLEAQSFGLPCVVSNIPGNLAVVEHGVNGCVVPVGDAEALALAIVQLLDDPELRVRYGHSARDKMEKFFSMKNSINRLFNIYGMVFKYRSV